MEWRDSHARAIWALLIAAVVILCGVTAARAGDDPAPSWPQDVPVPAEGVAPSVAAGRAAGHVRGVWWIGDVDVDATWSAWLARFDGWRPVAIGGAGERWATFEDTRGRRVRVWMNDGTGRGGVAGSAEVLTKVAPVALPGPCVAIPQRRFVWTIASSAEGHDGELHRSTRDVAYSTARAADVDFDGVVDVFVPVVKGDGWEARCPEALRYDVYVVRGACGHLVGRVEGERVLAEAWDAPLGPAGLVALYMDAQTTELSDPTKPRGGRGALPVLTTVRRVYDFDGQRYQLRTTSRQGGVCHHCAYWTCSGPRATPVAP